MDRIDLRSDTVTWPTPRMRQAMAEAPVGDDVYGEDPTVNALQAQAAALFDKEAGLLVASGTQGNITALMTHCGRGDRAIMGNIAHTHLYEAGNPAALGGIQTHMVPVQPDGSLRLEDLEAGITSDDSHYPVTRVISIENTQGSVGGQPLPASYIEAVGALAHKRGLHLHIDGARIFNAAAALETSVAELCAAADSVTFCLSKGLCAPVGSVLVGSHDFIRRAHRVRKLLGGGMRQAGIIAAAGLVALEEMPGRLHEDHAKARALADALAQMPCIQLDPAPVRTNMIFFDLHPDAPLDAEQLAERLRADNIWIGPFGKWRVRLVTHYWIMPEHVEFVAQRMRHHLA
ncbi:MAG: low-specificity L-threonine aldolase [Anaerolineae bacterium]|nr:low-specificity L-threonine aldolase [Anaerolineae bacterium]